MYVIFKMLNIANHENISVIFDITCKIIYYICSTNLIIKTDNDKKNGKKGNFDTFH